MFCNSTTSACEGLLSFCRDICKTNCICFNECLVNSIYKSRNCPNEYNKWIIIYASIPSIYISFYYTYSSYKKIQVEKSRTCGCIYFVFHIGLFLYIGFLCYKRQCIGPVAFCNLLMDSITRDETLPILLPIPQEEIIICPHCRNEKRCDHGKFYCTQRTAMNNYFQCKQCLEKVFPKKIKIEFKVCDGCRTKTLLERKFPTDVVLSLECSICYTKQHLCILGCRHTICKLCLPQLSVCALCRKNIDQGLIKEYCEEV